MRGLLSTCGEINGRVEFAAEYTIERETKEAAAGFIKKESIMDLKTINEQPDGFCPPELTVKIMKVWERKSGTNDTGDWSFQNVDVEQDGQKATLKLKNLPVFPESRIGMTVTIRANKSAQHGMTGIKTETRVYQNKTYKSITITPSGRWEWAEPGKEQSNGHAPAVAPQAATNGHSSDTSYADHVLACAELANVVILQLELDDPQAMQACFATICIDTKNRNILLPPPEMRRVAAPAVPAEVEREPEEPPEDLQDDPFGEDPIPF